MHEAFDPYHVWLGIRPKDQPPNHYRLLGLELFESDADAISSAADARTSHVRANHKGHAAAAQQILKELAAARRCLLNDQQKAAYDRQLREAQARRVEPTITAVPAPVPTLNPAAASALPPRLPAAQSERPVVSVASSPGAVKSQRTQGSPAWVWLVLLGVPVLMMLALVAWAGIGFLGFLRGHANERSDPIASGAVGAGDRPTDPPDARPEPTDKEDHDGQATPKGANGDDPTEDTNPGTATTNPTPPQTEPGSNSPSPTAEPASGIDGTPSNVSPANPSENAAPAEPGPPPRRPIPPQAELDAAVAEVRQVLAEEMDAAVRPSEKVLLAERLLQVAEDERDEHARHLAMLLEARRLAIEAIEPRSFLRAVEIISAAYEADPWTMQRQALLEAARAAKFHSEFKTLAAAGIDAAEDAARQQQFAAAGQLTLFAGQAAGRCNDPRVQQEIDERSAAVEQQHALHKQLAAARATLATAPDDPAANLTLGRHLCLTEGDWKEGLPHLARGGDTPLAQLAAEELAVVGATVPGDLAVQARLADDWWAASEQLQPPQQRMAMRHAAAWYRRVLDELTGLERTKADVRLAQVAELEADEEGPLATGDTIVLDLDVATQKLAVELGNYSVLDPPRVRVTLANFSTPTALDPSDGQLPLSNKSSDKLVVRLTQVEGAEIHIQFRESASGRGEVVVRPVYHAERQLRPLTNDGLQDSSNGIQRAVAERKRRQTADRNAVASLPTQIALLRSQTGGSDFERLRRTTLVGKLQSQLRSAQRNLPNHQRMIADMEQNLREMEHLATLARSIHKRARLRFERVE